MSKRNEVTWSKFVKWCDLIIEKLELKDNKPDVVYGIARGGIIPAYFISKKLGTDFYPIIRMKQILFQDPLVKRDFDEILIVDDRSQSGESLEFSKQHIIELYSKRWNKKVNVKTGLLNSFEEINELPADYVVRKSSFCEKVVFPWDSNKKIPSMHPDKRSITEAIQKYNEVKEFIKSAYDKNPDIFYETLSESEKKELLKFFEGLSKESPSQVAEHFLMAKIIGLANLEELEKEFTNLKTVTTWPRYFDYSKDWKNYGDKTRGTYYIILDSLKSVVFEFNVYQFKGSFYLKVFPRIYFTRCEPGRSEPHLLCYNNCKFEDCTKHRSVHDPRTIECFGVTSALITVSKLKYLIGTLENLKIKKMA